MSNKSLIIHLVYLLPMPLGIMKYDEGIKPLMFDGITHVAMLQ